MKNGPLLWRAYVQPTAGKVMTNVDVTLSMADKAFSGPVTYSLSFDGGEAVSGMAMATAGEAKIRAIVVPSPKVWSTTTPNLHTVAVMVDGQVVTERFGLRDFNTDKVDYLWISAVNILGNLCCSSCRHRRAPASR